LAGFLAILVPNGFISRGVFQRIFGFLAPLSLFENLGSPTLRNQEPWLTAYVQALQVVSIETSAMVIQLAKLLPFPYTFLRAP